MTRDTGRWRSRVLSQCCRLLTDFHPRRSRTRDGMSSVQCPDPRHTEHRRAWCNHRPSSIYTLDHQLTADYSGQEIYSVERVRGAAQHPPVTCHVSSCHVNLAAISKQTFLRNNPAILSHNGQHGSGRREQRAVTVPTPPCHSTHSNVNCCLQATTLLLPVFNEHGWQWPYFTKWMGQIQNMYTF